MEEEYENVVPVIEGEPAECGDLPAEAEEFVEDDE